MRSRGALPVRIDPAKIQGRAVASLPAGRATTPTRGRRVHTQDFIDEYERYRLIGEKAMAQVTDEALNRVLAPDGNSIAMLVRHIGGNLASRFTDFLASDGEKPWRDRDSEFADGTLTRRQADELWTRGWTVLESTLRGLTDADLEKIVVTRGIELTVHAALSRSVTHIAMHVGQIV